MRSIHSTASRNPLHAVRTAVTCVRPDSVRGRLVEGVERGRRLQILLHPALDHRRGLLDLRELTDHLADGVERTSTLSSGYLCVAATAIPDTMYCSGIPSGFGFSGFSHASVQSLRSIRAGLPVKERLRTVSRLLALA